MDSEELLAQLADIHLPEPVSFWPPAPGWWLLALLLLIGIAYLAYRLQQARIRRKIVAFAMAELDKCYQSLASSTETDANLRQLRYVNEVNSVLRRVALVHYPQANVASLAGQAWVDFIRQKGDSSLLDDDIAKALSHGRFQTRCEVDVEALHALAQAWVKSLYTRPAVSQEPGTNSAEGEDQPIHA